MSCRKRASLRASASRTRLAAGLLCEYDGAENYGVSVVGVPIISAEQRELAFERYRGLRSDPAAGDYREIRVISKPRIASFGMLRACGPARITTPTSGSPMIS